MEDTELAYLAGFFDGEGCCTICAGKSSTTDNISIRPRIAITNTVSTSLTPYLNEWGGSIFKTKRFSDTHKDCYTWSLYGIVKIREFLIDILPYLVIKRNQAFLLWELCDLGNWRGGQRRIPPEIIVKRKKITEKLMRLNKKGKNAKHL